MWRGGPARQLEPFSFDGGACRTRAVFLCVLGLSGGNWFSTPLLQSSMVLVSCGIAVIHVFPNRHKGPAAVWRSLHLFDGNDTRVRAERSGPPPLRTSRPLPVAGSCDRRERWRPPGLDRCCPGCSGAPSLRRRYVTSWAFCHVWQPGVVIASAPRERGPGRVCCFSTLSESYV